MEMLIECNIGTTKQMNGNYTKKTSQKSFQKMCKKFQNELRIISEYLKYLLPRMTKVQWGYFYVREKVAMFYLFFSLFCEASRR